MMKPSLRFIILVVFGAIYLQSTLASGAEQFIYLDANAGDGGDGSFNSPFDEFSDINWNSEGERSVPDWVSAGDDVKIRLKRGSVWYERLNVRASGNEAHPIVIEPYGDGDMPVIDGSGSSVAILILEQHHISINRISLTNCSFAALHIPASQSIQISNCQISDSQVGGIQIESRDRIDVSDISIEGCSFFRLGANGILLVINGWGSERGDGDGTIYDVEINNNSFETIGNNAISTVGGEDVLTSHGGIAAYEIVIEGNSINNTDHAAIGIRGLRDIGRGNVIRGNVLTNIGAPELPDTNALQLNWVTGLTIEDNLIDTVRTSKTDGAAIILDYAWNNNLYLSENVVIRRNIIKNCTSLGTGKGIGIWKAKNSLIYSNLIINCSSGIRISNPESTGTVCYNNTIVGATDGIFMLKSGEGTVLYNNIVYQSQRYGIYAFYPESLDSDYNSVHGSADVNFKFRDVGTKGENSIELDPEFLDAANSVFQLSPNSPCVDSGLNNDFITSDIIGTPVPHNNTIDMGAFEMSDQIVNLTPAAVQNFRLVN